MRFGACDVAWRPVEEELESALGESGCVCGAIANLPQPSLPQTNRGIRSFLTVAALRSAPKTVPTCSQQIYLSVDLTHQSLLGCLFVRAPLFQSTLECLSSGFAPNKIVHFVARTIMKLQDKLTDKEVLTPLSTFSLLASKLN
jgi:hypothetical protein